MATLNVGAMAARLGLDPSEFLDKMKGVQGFNGFVSGEMARQWKKTGRDGQEGMRLIDEALGIHVARPVARIVSETFPALGKAMSSILPGVAFTALGVAIFEFAEGISKKMDEAKKKQEDYNDAVLKTKEVSAQAAAESQKTFYGLKAKEAGLAGDTQGEARFKAMEANAEAAEKMAKYVDALVGAERREVAASLALMPVWSELGDIWHRMWSSDAKLGVESVGEEIKTFEHTFADLSSQDALKGTTTAAKYLNDQLDESQNKIDALVAKQAEALANFSANTMGMEEGFVRPGALGPTDEEVNAEKARHEKLVTMRAQADRDDANAKLQAANAAKQAAQGHVREVRSEIESLERLGQTSTAAAASALLLASATGKGAAETIRATAAAEAQKKILDATAEANTKLFSDSKQPVGNDKRVQQKLAEFAVIERGNALTSAAAKAAEELNHAIAEQSTHDNERISALAAEADGHSKVAAEQAKELAGLIPLQQKLQALKDLRAGLNQPAIGPPTALAGQLDSQIAQANAALTAETDKKNKVVNPQIQLGAFREELEKIRDQTAALAGAEVSPWAKIDAEVEKLTGDLKLAPEQIAGIRQALTALQDVKIGGEFDKLAEKIKEAGIETAALATGSPFAKLDAEAQKIGYQLGIKLPEQIALLRQGLIELQAVENTGKAFAGVDALNASGGHMRELQQQMDALRRAASTGQTDDGTALSPATLAAVRLEMRAITDEQDKLLLKTGDIGTGFRAWIDDLQKVQSAGELTFEALSQASKGFEDTAIKSVMTVMDAQRGEHRKLIAELEKMWSQYFASLAQMGMKKGMDQLLAPLGRAISGGMSGDKNKPAPNLAPTSPGSLTGLGALIPKAGQTAGGAASLTSAGTVLHTAATALLSAATALRASAAGGMGGASGGGAEIPFFGGGAGAGMDAGAAIPFFAAGGDATPGSSFISGEAGAEQVDLDRAGGAHITPLGANGGDTHQHFDMRGAVVTDDLMRRAEAAHMMKASEGRMMQAIPAMQREISQRKRT